MIVFNAGLSKTYANKDPSVIQVLPPLIIQQDKVAQVLGTLDVMLGNLEDIVL